MKKKPTQSYLPTAFVARNESPAQVTLDKPQHPSTRGCGAWELTLFLIFLIWIVKLPQSQLTIMAVRLLAGKSAVVTGGVTGIGRAIALGFLHNGASVTVNHLGNENSQEQFESLRAEAPRDAQIQAVAGDIGKRETGTAIVRAAVESFGGLDVFVANAGVSQFRDFLT